MTTETIKSAAAYHMIEKAKELLKPEHSDTKNLDTIVRIEGVILDLELSMSKRNRPFTAEEMALLDRLDGILRRAKELYLTT